MTTELAEPRGRGRTDDQGRLLVERELELAGLRLRLAEAARGLGGVVLIEAAAGCGKSRLLLEAGAMARDGGMRVLEARGAELEGDFPFGVALQLFETLWRGAHADAREHLVSGPARLVADMMMGLTAEAGAFAADRAYALIHGLFWLARNLVTPPASPAELAPVAMLVDDVHWADWPSLRFLAYLAERVPTLPIALVLAARTGETSSDPRALAALRKAAGDGFLRPVRLSEKGVAMLVRAGFPHADSAFTAACAKLTDGNPFLLVELLEEVHAAGARPDAKTATELAGLIPASVSERVSSALAALTPEARALAAAVAVLGDGAPLRRAAEVAELELDTARWAADALARVHVFHPTAPLRFMHLLDRLAVRASMTDLRRGHLHRRAAATLIGEGASDEQIAAHLLAATPEADPRTVEVLRTAAEAALNGGAPEHAARLLQRALDEGLDGPLCSEVMAELAYAELAAGLPEAAQRIADAIDLTDERTRRAQLALAQGQALHAERRYEEAAGVLMAALGELDEHEVELADELEAAYIAAATFVPGLRQDGHQRGKALLKRIDGHPTPAQRVAIAHLAIQSSHRGEPRAFVADLAELAWGDGALLDAELPIGMVWPFVAGSLMYVGELERSLEICDAAVRAAEPQNAALAAVAARYCRTWSLYHQGRITEALAEAEASVAAGSEGWYRGGVSAYAAIAACQLHRGELDRAERTLALLDQPAAVEEAELPVLLDVRAQVRLAQLRPRDALSDAVEAGRRSILGLGGAGPGVLAWRTTAALAHLALGESADAIRLAGEELDLARRSGVTRVVIRALRVLGLAEREARRLELLEEAVGLGDGSPPRLEHVHALIELGGALRRANRRSAAREPLRRGLELAHQGGSRMLAEQARRELNATGARPRRAMLSGLGALTPSERRVADLAVRGLTTRQIAEALYVTPKTVEYHLRHIYRKLDISSSRAELVRALTPQESVESSSNGSSSNP